jgi:hypothetical protein
MVGESNPESKVVINCRGEEFPTIRSACLKYSIGRVTLSSAINGERVHAGKYEDGTRIKWKYKR